MLRKGKLTMGREQIMGDSALKTLSHSFSFFKLPPPPHSILFYVGKALAAGQLLKACLPVVCLVQCIIWAHGIEERYNTPFVLFIIKFAISLLSGPINNWNESGLFMRKDICVALKHGEWKAADRPAGLCLKC